MINRLLHQHGLDATQIGARQKTFSAVYESDGRYNERKYIESVLQAVSAEGHMVIPTAERLVNDLEQLVWHQDEPFQSTSIFAQWCVMSLAHEHGVKVILDGQGADELLGGYRPYLYHLADVFRSKHPHRFVRELTLTYVRGNEPLRALAKQLIKSIIAHTSPHTYHALQKFRQTKAKQALAKDFIATSRHEDSPVQYHSNLDDLLRNALVENSLPNLLRYEDRNSMAFSIEARVPFLDHRLVEFVLQYSPHLRLYDGWTKWLHRQAMTGIVPSSIAWRRDKVGFETPETTWQRHLLDKRSDLFDRTAYSRSYLDLSVVQNRIAQWMEYGGDTRLIWRWISLEAWLRVWHRVTSISYRDSITPTG